MNEQDKAHIISYRLIRAKEAIVEAELLLQANHFNTAVNRIYYSCFYAVSALLISEGVKAAKYSGVKQMFGLHFVTPGKIPEEYGRFYTLLFNKRQKGDYDDLIFFERGEVESFLPQSKELVAVIENYLRRQG